VKLSRLFFLLFSLPALLNTRAVAACVAAADKTVNICSPVNGSSVSSPVQFTAAARDDEYPITGMVLYVDSTQQGKSTNSTTLSASVALTAGQHAIVVRAWDSTGAYFSSSETISVTSSAGLGSVKHVIFMLQENRSFDTYFGMLNPYRATNGFNRGDDGNTYLVDGIDDKLNTITNQDDEGDVFHLFHTTSTCLDDMSSAWLESFGDVSRWNFTPQRSTAMDGFVHTAEGFAKSGAGQGQFTDTKGQRAMAYYRDVDVSGVNPELNYYYYIASQFALSDRWFSPIASKSIPNRLATLTGGTTQGYVFDPANDDHAPQLTAQTIFQLLDAHNVSWKIYYEHTNSDGTPSTTFTYFGYSGKYIYRNSSGQLVIDSTHIAPISQYYQDVANGTLPQFSYIESDYGVSDEHPGSGQSILTGQQNVADIINALMYSASWSDSVFFLSFDEGGGPYDHVPPVPGSTNKNTSAALASVEGDVSAIAVNPDGYLPCLPSTAGVYSNHCDLRPDSPGANPNDAAAKYGFAAQIGFRVPNMIISPFARRHYVGHKAMDHTGVLHFVEELYQLPALTKRDAAQPDLLDFFDFNGKPWATPPSQSNLPIPPAVGSTCHPSVMQ
jgi:phospholipase C